MTDWKKMVIAAGVGFVVVMGMLTIASILRPPEISCVRVYSDGSYKTFFGKDCSKPN
jgi:hypothetical protein